MADPPPPAERGSPQGGHPPAAVDVQKLADKVYALMKADLRLARARGAGEIEHRRQT